MKKRPHRGKGEKEAEPTSIMNGKFNQRKEEKICTREEQA